MVGAHIAQGQRNHIIWVPFLILIYNLRLPGFGLENNMILALSKWENCTKIIILCDRIDKYFTINIWMNKLSIIVTSTDQLMTFYIPYSRFDSPTISRNLNNKSIISLQSVKLYLLIYKLANKDWVVSFSFIRTRYISMSDPLWRTLICNFRCMWYNF